MIYILLRDTIYRKKVLLFIKSSDILVDVVRNADLAQLAEHVISNDEVEGSNPLVSTYKSPNQTVGTFLLANMSYIIDNFKINIILKV